MTRVWPGRPRPLGATADAEGVNFALFAEHAKGVEICLFDDPAATSESDRIPLPECTGLVWHGFLPGVRPGQLYGYRVQGPYEPGRGHRFNPRKVLLDPYARAIGRETRWDDALFGYPAGGAEDGADDRDSAPFAPLGRVEPALSGPAPRPLRTPWHETVVYELHVRGFTRRHPGVPEPLRGTYAGLASPASVEHLRSLGVTAVELLPIHHHLGERFLVQGGRTNYWGYNTLAFFAPHPRYAASGPAGAVAEFRSMVASLHAAGIEVFLDVVYNHTAEGDHRGPTLSLRGIDNAAYYHLAEDPRRYVDFSGTGNSLNMRHPRALQLIMDSLRYWVLEMGVDGFRFDLASALAREMFEVDRLGSFFDIIQQDPVLSEVKLIAEPWDLGPGGYQVGNFPVLWSEWNGRYRDTVRRFWRGEAGVLGELAGRLSGSADLYQDDGRRPTASLNFLTCHDGFTLNDLVSYERKHNEANGEENRDGTEENWSANHGAEGPTEDPGIRARRGRTMRNLMATLLLSQGVPMILAGDEIGNTQQGNNNAYCQDNEISWLDWDRLADQRELLEFVRRLVRLRREEPVFRRRRFFQGRRIFGEGVKDIFWLAPDGREMGEADWNARDGRCLGVGLVGDQIDETGEHGERIVGNSFLFLLNGAEEAVDFRLGERGRNLSWELVFDTDRPGTEGKPETLEAGYPLSGRSAALLRLAAPPA